MASRRLLTGCCLMLVAFSAAVAGQGASPWADCPETPNCVSSTASDPARRVDALQVIGAQELAWKVIRDQVAGLARSRIVAEDGQTLHAEISSLLFGFVDDLQLSLDPATGVVELRSASRTGEWDMGVNRRRVDALVESLITTGVVNTLAR